MNKKILFALISFLSFPFTLIFAQPNINGGGEGTVSAENTLDVSSFSGSVQEAMSNPDYRVTAGDVYSLTYAANGTAVSYTIAVDSTYRIRVSNLAVLDVSGKSYLTVKKQVEEIVQKNYPLSGVQFVLLNPATYKIVIKGEVTQTTERSVWALTRLSSVVSGITTPYSSVRDITVTSANGNKKVYDLFKASREGDLSQNPYLRPGDVITINRILRKVTISGSVERPGTYELMKGENLKELIEYYGNGLTELADTRRIELTRFLETKEGNESGEKIYLNQDDFNANYPLECFDVITVYSYKSLKPVMFVEGAIQVNEGVSLESSTRKIIQFESGTDYAYLIRENNSLFKSAVADTKNAYIIRGEQTIPINLDNILYNSSYNTKILVQANDVLVVPFRQYFVTVAGSVNAPGRFPYIPDRTADYYIGLAGGFDKTQNFANAMNIVDINGKKLKSTDIITPETTITAKANSFTYYFTRYSGVLTVLASLITTTISVITVINSN